MALEWIPLTEYSNKYKVSISTLRRKIKANGIKYSFKDGKYFIYDGPIDSHQSLGRSSRPSLTVSSSSLLENEAKTPMRNPTENSLMPRYESFDERNERDEKIGEGIGAVANEDEPILTTANKLLNELKKAYTQILHEKEEQILQLNAEISDLNTLVTVLESENKRLGGKVSFSNC